MYPKYPFKNKTGPFVGFTVYFLLKGVNETLKCNMLQTVADCVFVTVCEALFKSFYCIHAASYQTKEMMS